MAKKIKIDWPNHIIAFFSALFGILIAFQLDEWKENSDKQMLANEAFRLVQNETRLNKTILRENINRNDSSIRKVSTVLPYLDERLNFVGTFAVADSINRSNPFVRVLLPTPPKSGKFSAPVYIGLDQIIAPDIHTSAWESAKATGALNYMALEKVDLLSLIYTNTKLRDELSGLRTVLKQTDEAKSRADIQKILSSLDRSNRIILRELETFESYASILENIE